MLADSAPKHKEHIMTVADQLREQGMHEGVILGEKKGIEKAAKGMLLEGLSHQVVFKETGLTIAQLETIKSSLIIH